MMLCHLISSLFISSFFMRAIVFLMCLRPTIYAAASGKNETDRQALLEFKAKITHDPSGVLSSWNDSIYFCQWYGISCGRRHQRVTVLDLPSLKLEGSISPHIGNLSFLTKLNLQNNIFIHEIPQELGHLRRLTHLDLMHNSIGGKIHTNISSSSNLLVLNLPFNPLEGEIPLEIVALVKLQFFAIEQSNLTGSIPQSVGNLSSLEILYLPYNNFVGSIPDSIGQLTELIGFNFLLNSLSGTIPPSIYNLSSIKAFYFGDNFLKVSNASEIVYLQPPTNKFTGKVPSLGNLQQLQLKTLALCDNQIYGSIPSKIDNLDNLQALAAVSNQLSGNFLQGPIPSSLGSLRALQFLRLSRNNFSGEIPECLSQFAMLQYLNLSYDNFKGMVPVVGVFKNASAISIKGNSNLCGGIPELKLPACSSKRPKKSSKSALTFVLHVVFGIFGLVTFILVFWIKRERKQPGSFGSVYKGKLDEGGQPVAIKVLNLKHHGAFKSFKAECEASRNIRHRNLVKVLLHPETEAIEGADVAPRNLILFQRVNIAIDVACALVYLHQLGDIPIVHCVLKPSNILLDEEMTGRLGDFGLVKFLHDQAQSSSIGPSSSIELRCFSRIWNGKRGVDKWRCL